RVGGGVSIALRFGVGDQVVVASSPSRELSPAARLYAGNPGAIVGVNGDYVPYPYKVRFEGGEEIAFAPDELVHEGDVLAAQEDFSSAQKIEVGESDAINHPDHYTWLPNGLEVIDITAHFGFVRGNALKYLMRADFKGKTLEDLKKARWYINYEINQLEAQQ
ncbi:DUF3310 domain-containing protein, partial [Streptomyces althioticus]|uniref:DUF3310 domain-containing protein n=1 Tax=Streptomyces althioticus TaxID=83380 RepID=UPI0036F9A9B6